MSGFFSGSTNGSTPEQLSFSVAAREAAEQVAIVSDQGVWTFGQLAPLVEQAARWFGHRLAVLEPQHVHGSEGTATVPAVAVVGVNRLPQLVAIYALIDLGIPFVLVHPRWTATERSALLEPLGPSVILDENWRLPLDAEGTKQHAAPLGAALPEPQNTLAVVFTSGTSSQPKGAVSSRGAWLASVAASAENLGWQDDDRWLLSLPVAHVGGLSIVTRTLAARRALVLLSAESSDEQRLIDAIEGHRVTLLSLVPTQLYRLLELTPRWDPPSFVRAILVGGARASSDLVARARRRGWPLLLTYGMTEACSQIATQRLPPDDAVPTDLEEAAGPPLQGVELRIRRQDAAIRRQDAAIRRQDAAIRRQDAAIRRQDAAIRRQDAAIRRQDAAETGEIEVRGPMLFDGYLSAWVGGWRIDRQCFRVGGWFSTGDIGRLDREGRLVVVDRASDLIISGGENVSPTEIEAVLERHPMIATACVFGVEDEEWGECVAAVAVPTSGHPAVGQSGEQQQPSPQDLVSFLEAALAGFKRPRYWAWLDSLPTSASGKVDRVAVRDRAVEQGLEPLPRSLPG